MLDVNQDSTAILHVEPLLVNTLGIVTLVLAKNEASLTSEPTLFSGVYVNFDINIFVLWLLLWSSSVFSSRYT